VSLRALPDHFVATRDALHQIAFFAVSPARYKVTGSMGLRATPGGFGTPPFGDRVARVDGDLLVHEQAGNLATQSITSVRAATEFFGNRYEVDWFADFHDPLHPVDPDLELEVDEAAARALGDWFGFGAEVLDRLRAQALEDDYVGEVQLWPEHFDVAAELGREDRGQRAAFGASPGDGAHPDPYFYVSPWAEVDNSNPYWNDESFGGASIGYPALVDASDPGRAALDFLLEGHRILHSS
jgi:hypothetical protein